MAFLRANPNNSGLRGRLAGQVYAESGEDTIVRSFTKPSFPDTPAQQAQEARFTRGTQGWGGLTDLQRSAWSEAARSVHSKSARRIAPKAISGSNLFTALTSKFLQVNPGGTVPVEPPTTRFVADSVQFTVAATSGEIQVTGSGANADGTTTEFLVQRLDAAYRKPTGAYRHAAFATFQGPSMIVPIHVAAGAYAVAIQYVDTASGRVTGFQALGATTVLSAVAGGLSDEDGFKKAA